jgi:cell division protein FtsA
VKSFPCIAAIEIGTSKIVVLVGEVLSKKRLNLIGMSEVPSRGIQKGEVVDFKSAIEATHAALEAAEKSAEVQLEKIYLAQTGGHLQGFFHTGTVNVGASDSIVAQADIDRCISEAKHKKLPEDRVYVHHIHNGFSLDERAILEPLGMQGHKLTAGYWSVHADVKRLRDMIHLVNGFGLTVADVMASSVASAKMVTTPSERKSGTLVIDMGAGTTDYALYREGFIVHTGVLPVGGDHLTNDLSLAFRLDRSRAESLKCDMGKAIWKKDDQNETFWLLGDRSIGDRSFPKKALVSVLEARLREIFQIIQKRLQPVVDFQQLSAGIVLTGGAALLPRMTELAENVLGCPVRLGENPSWVREDLRLPGYSTVLGLLSQALTEGHDTASQQTSQKPLWNRLAKLLHLTH